MAAALPALPTGGGDVRLTAQLTAARLGDRTASLATMPTGSSRPCTSSLASNNQMMFQNIQGVSDLRSSVNMSIAPCGELADRMILLSRDIQLKHCMLQDHQGITLDEMREELAFQIGQSSSSDMGTDLGHLLVASKYVELRKQMEDLCSAQKTSERQIAEMFSSPTPPPSPSTRSHGPRSTVRADGSERHHSNVFKLILLGCPSLFLVADLAEPSSHPKCSCVFFTGADLS